MDSPERGGSLKPELKLNAVYGISPIIHFVAAGVSVVIAIIIPHEFRDKCKTLAHFHGSAYTQNRDVYSMGFLLPMLFIWP